MFLVEINTSQMLSVSEIPLHLVYSLYLLKKYFISWKADTGDFI